MYLDGQGSLFILLRYMLYTLQVHVVDREICLTGISHDCSNAGSTIGCAVDVIVGNTYLALN
jgi:hypothetical protein